MKNSAQCLLVVFPSSPGGIPGPVPFFRFKVPGMSSRTKKAEPSPRCFSKTV